uniref:quinol:cytochrome C oxidoreductase n=1 Tax=Winogradskyella sp. TaxID=1883156 RepID=UPI0025CE9D1A
MEYKISNRLKMGAIIMIVLGALGVAYGFFDSQGYTEANITERLAEEHHGHGDAHAEDTHTDSHAEADLHVEDSHGEEAHGASHADEDHGMSHEEHVLHQIHNRPYSALYVAAFFFFMIALGVLAFYAVQYASQAGWSPVLFRVMEGITAYVLPGGLIVLAIAFLADSHLFVWLKEGMTTEGHDNYDALVAGKSGWLNKPWFFIRGLIFLGGWYAYRHFSRKFSVAQDNTDVNDNRYFKKNFRISAAFLVFFIYTESMMSWDWIMSVDPHWFSTLFGWYLLAGMLVCGITVIAMIAIYLKSKGLLEHVNDSHIHDLAKFMFGFSIFWTYLWFSQFMLIWYSNIPEEVTYFVTRIEDYNLPFFGMVAMNFVFPFLLLMNSDYKRIPWFVVMAGIVILCGHYVDIF